MDLYFDQVMATTNLSTEFPLYFKRAILKNSSKKNVLVAMSNHHQGFLRVTPFYKPISKMLYLEDVQELKISESQK